MPTTVNTNAAAYVALRNLRDVQGALAATEKQVSTGYTVADAFDNGAVFGVAQLVRGDIAANQAASEELGNFTGLVQTASAGATQVSQTLSEIRAVLTHLSSQTLSTTQFGQYFTQYNSLVDSINKFTFGSTYNGQNLLSSSQSLSVLADQKGGTIAVSGSSYLLAQTSTTVTTAGADVKSATDALVSVGEVIKGWAAATASGTSTDVSSAAASIQAFLNTNTLAGFTSIGFNAVENSTSTVLNAIGALNRQATAQINFNSTLRDSLSVGLGSLVDADLAKQSANLTALQVKQQLATQALSIANQAPNILTTLFR